MERRVGEMNFSWKKLLAGTAAALLIGVLFGSWLGNRGSAESEGRIPAAPKEAIAQLKFGDRVASLYEYEGAGALNLQGVHSNLAVTKDAIYGISAENKENTYHLKKLNIKDGAIVSVEDFGLVANAPLSSDGTNVYYFHKGDGVVACCDGKEAVTFNMQGVRVLRAVFGENKAYAGGGLVSEFDTVVGSISRHGMKNAKSILMKDEFAKPADSGTVTEENNAFLLGADRDGFYVAALAAHGGFPEGGRPLLHMYGPNGRKLRTFECNANLPGAAEKRASAERQVVVTKDYVVFYASGCMRVFDKKNGKYVGDVELKLRGRNLEPCGAAADDENHIYFIGDQRHIYRLDLL